MVCKTPGGPVLHEARQRLRMEALKHTSLGLNPSTKKTRKREFLDEMERVVPWKVLVEVIEPYWLKSNTGRPPLGIETMLHIHDMQPWFGLSDPAMEGVLHDGPL